ncbi:efflux RND transporter periplasmic adaptor subunit [bacterium]|nr:efflux RND transporter periplasmic adaptor subunit [bacterium]
MKRSRKSIIWIIVCIIVVLIVVAISMGKNDSTENSRQLVKVERKDIIDKALAVGSIEPVTEIAVKSKVSGVVGNLFVGVGDFVKKGDPILEVKPDPTPFELVQSKRNVEMRQIALSANRKELERNEALRAKNLISDYDLDKLRLKYDEAELNHRIAVEQLQLLEEGKVQLDGQRIETVIKSPITGYILEKTVNIGDPIVPLTSYQAGTELMKMADMKRLIFRGTVDEIDVGKIEEGLEASLQIGALPGKIVTGRVILISLKARKEQNTTVFPIEILIEEAGDVVLRAGFSANAHIIIAKKENALSLPERVIYFSNDSTFVELPMGEVEKKKVLIKTGLSDAINIEIISGLEEGQEVLEKEVKEIT